MKSSALLVPCLLAIALAVPAMADTTVKVKLSDAGADTDFSQNMGLGLGMKGDMSKAMAFLEVDTASVPAGKVTFEVTNTSAELEHEMLVASIAGADAKLSYDDAKNRLSEDSLGSLGEVAELAPGKTGTLTLDLKPGQYAVFCNVTGHFMAGMWKVIEVK
jgi:uncharacterized cupredoxin-like copper-binding protein